MSRVSTSHFRDRVRLCGCAGLLLTSLVGCEESRAKPSAPLERSQVVAASPTATATSAPTPAQPVQSVQAPKKPRRALCDGKLRDSGKALPKKSVSRAQSAAGTSLPQELAAAGSGLTWVNFWAAWCEPCKEEIPILLAWERQLKSEGEHFRLSFVSLDDDERQLNSLLQSGTLKASYWLKEGREREDWMKAAGLEGDPELPVHLLVDSRGKIRCKVNGAITTDDLADLRRLLAAAR